MTKRHNAKRIVAMVGSAAMFMAGMVLPFSAANAAETKLDPSYKDKSSQLAAFDFEDLTAGQTGEFSDENRNANAVIQGSAAVAEGKDGGTAAKLSSGFWMGITGKDGASPLKGKHAVTISFDAFPNNTNDTGWPLYAQRSGATPTGGTEKYLGFLYKGGKLTVERYNNLGSRETAANTTASVSAGWQHIDYVATDEGAALYVNGEEKASANTEESASLPAILGEDGGVLQLGKANWGGGEYLNGLIDNFEIYDCSEPAAKAAMSSLSLPSTATENFTVPTQSNGKSITWTSSDAAIAVDAHTGTVSVARPGIDQKDAKVTVTARLNGVSEEVSKTFTVTVPRLLSDKEKAQSDLDAVTIKNADDMRGNFLVPTTGNEGSDIVWTVKTADSVPPVVAEGSDADHKVVKVERPATGQPAETVVLTAVSTHGQASVTKDFTIKIAPIPSDSEEQSAYVWAFFTGEGAGAEKISLAASKGNNALDWNTLNNGEPLFTSELGEKGLRDPFIIKSHEGDKFYMLATDLKIDGRAGSFDGAQRNGSKYIEVWESNDLVNWSEQRHVKVSSDYAGNTWAPEAFWDAEIGKYVVYWASNLYDTTNAEDRTKVTYNRMMYVTTDDFITFSEPKTWVDVDQGKGKGMIDATIAKEDGMYYRFYKDESSMTIREEKSTNLLSTITGSLPKTAGLAGSNQWSLVKEKIGVGQPNGYNGTFSAGEGPSIFKANKGDVNGNKWYLFIDQPSYHGGPNHYIAFKSNNIADGGSFTAQKYDSLPTNVDGGKPRHGTVIPVSRAQYEKVLAAYAPAIAVKSVEAVSVETTVGVDPSGKLPESVKLTKQDGSEEVAAVEWDSIDANSYAQEGSFNVRGTAQDASRAPVEATISVKDDKEPNPEPGTEEPGNTDNETGKDSENAPESTDTPAAQDKDGNSESSLAHTGTDVVALVALLVVLTGTGVFFLRRQRS